MIVKYIAKHGTQGMFDGIEKIIDKPYEWAISKFENYPKMPRNKKGKLPMRFKLFLHRTK